MIHLHGAKAPSDSDGYPEAWYHAGQLGALFLSQPATRGDAVVSRSRLGNRAAEQSTRDYPAFILSVTQSNSGSDCRWKIRNSTGDSRPDVRHRRSAQLSNFEAGPIAFGYRIFWQYRVGKWYRVSVPDGRTAQVSIPDPQCVERALLRPHAFFRTAVLPDWHRTRACCRLRWRSVSLLIAPAERADVIVDFAPYAARQIVLNNDAAAPYPGGGMVVPTAVDAISRRRADYG